MSTSIRIESTQEINAMIDSLEVSRAKVLKDSVADRILEWLKSKPIGFPFTVREAANAIGCKAISTVVSGIQRNLGTHFKCIQDSDKKTRRQALYVQLSLTEIEYAERKMNITITAFQKLSSTEAKAISNQSDLWNVFTDWSHTAFANYSSSQSMDSESWIFGQVIPIFKLSIEMKPKVNLKHSSLGSTTFHSV